MTEPKKRLRIFMFVGLIALNIVLLTTVLQHTLPDPTAQAKIVSHTNSSISAENQLFLPLVATAYGDPIVLLPGDGVYYERDQDLQIVHVLGEVLNNTPTTVSQVTVEARLNLKTGRQITLRGAPLVGSLAPGNRACFDLYVVEAEEVESYALQVLSCATGGTVPGGVAPEVSNAGLDTQNGWYIVEGTISTTEPTVLNDLRAVVTLFDSSGRVLGCEQSYVRTQTEEANTPATFRILFMNRDFSEVSSYILAIAGAVQ